MLLSFMIIPGKMKIALFLPAVGNWLYDVAHDDAVLLAQQDFEFILFKNNKTYLNETFQLLNLITACTAHC